MPGRGRKPAVKATEKEEPEKEEEAPAPRTRRGKRAAETALEEAPAEKKTETPKKKAAKAETPKKDTETPAEQSNETPGSFEHKVPAGIEIPDNWKWHKSLLLTEFGDCKPSTKIAGFDYDGCLAKTSLFKKGPDAWSVLFPTCKPFLTTLHKEGYKLVIFTNQSEIGKAKASKQKAVNEKIARLTGFVKEMGLPFQVLAATDKDSFRKPSTGMWDFLTYHLNGGVTPDKSASFFVGDAAGRKKDHGDTDLGFAKAVGLAFHTETDFFQDNVRKISQ